MALVSAHKISMHFGGPLLLADVTAKVEPGQRIGMVGRNGSGKSTFLKLLGGMLEPTEGEVVRPGGTRVSYQAQELLFEPGRTVFEEMRAVFRHEAVNEQALRALEEELAHATDPEDRSRLLKEYERRQHRQEERGVYDIDRRIESVLTSLGLPESAWEQPVDAFSGGERNIIGLARVVLEEPDLMLLDEPSNHLDMEGVEWFIDFLRRSKTGFLMVSHNRHLLDATVREMWELRRQNVEIWTGNYSDFQRQKAEAKARQERQYKVQQRLIERIKFQARRLMDMANAYDDPGQAKRAKAMMKRIEQMDVVERPDSDRRSFKGGLGGQRHGRIALTVKDYSHAFGDRVLFDKANLEIEYGERVCLVGPNGSGKTTLFRALLEEGGWENPTLRLGKSVKVGEYRQLHDVLDANASLLDWCMRETGLIRRPASDLLHRFLFTHEDLDRTVGTLSGGEKSRLQLARLVQAEVNFLLLDEPTNHLDIPSCEVLEEMLEEFDGTLLVISHDRYFLDKLVGRVIEVEDHQLVDRRCSFAEWWSEWQRERGRLRRTALIGREGGESSDKEAARRSWHETREQQREQVRKENRVKRLEAEIHDLEARQPELEKAIEAAFATPSSTDEGARLSAELDRLKQKLAKRLAEWEAAAAALDP
jgi:ATP-binding cassette subfamily F protein 3